MSENERIEPKKRNRIFLFIACALLLYISGAIFYNKGFDRNKEGLLFSNPPGKVAVVYSAPYGKSLLFTYLHTPLLSIPSNQIIIMFIL